MEALRARTHEYSITFAAEVDLAAAAIEQRARDSTVRCNALLWRVRAIPEMRKACFRLEPIGALVDAWIFARQMDQLFAAGAFGAFQPEAVGVSRRLVDQIREIGGSIAVSPEARVEFEHKFIDPWLAEHPLRDITFVRESPIARFAEQFPARGDMFQTVGTMEELAIGLSRQARLYLADLPRQVGGEVDLMRSDVLPPETVASMQSDLHVSAAAADRIASTAEGISPRWPGRRRACGVLDRRGSLQDGDALEVRRHLRDERGIARLGRYKAALQRETPHTLAILRIPRLELEVPVYDGTADAVLDLAAGRIEDTALPGTPGNVGIAAHRDGFFRVLKDLREGDALVLDTPVATEQYRVEWIRITTPDDVSVIDPTPGPVVTLVGCYPFYHVGAAPQRFIVRAVPAAGSAVGD